MRQLAISEVSVASGTEKAATPKTVPLGLRIAREMAMKLLETFDKSCEMELIT